MKTAKIKETKLLKTPLSLPKWQLNEELRIVEDCVPNNDHNKDLNDDPRMNGAVNCNQEFWKK